VGAVAVPDTQKHARWALQARERGARCEKRLRGDANRSREEVESARDRTEVGHQRKGAEGGFWGR